MRRIARPHRTAILIRPDRRPLAALVVVAIVTVAGIQIVGRGSAASSSTVTVDYAMQVGTSQFRPGYTFDQCTLRVDVSQCGHGTVDEAAQNSARTLMKALPHFANVQLYGWGTANPMPTSTTYNLASFNKRLDFVRASGGTPMVTFCCSPDWMSGGQANDSYTSFMYDFPKPEFYDDYARLAAKVASDNPDVEYFQVWNEFKGLYAVNGSYARWNAEAYTDFYNEVYDAVKKVRPDAQIGGAYPAIRAWTLAHPQSNPSKITYAGLRVDQRGLDAMTYWLAHKRGAQFMTVDGGNGARDVRIDNPTGVYTEDGYAMCRAYPAIMDWLRSLDEKSYPGATTLPLVWAEWYSFAALTGNDDSTMSQCLIDTVRSGATTALIWGPEGRNATDASFPIGYWTGTGAGGGQATSFYRTAKNVADHFVPGTQLYKAIITGPVGALASGNGTLLVNHVASENTVSLNGRTVRLEGYQTRYVARSTAVTPTPTATAAPTRTPTPTTATPITGDINRDGHVNVLDLSALLSSWRSAGAADLNDDGTVNVLDLSILLGHWSG